MGATSLGFSALLKIGGQSIDLGSSQLGQLAKNAFTIVVDGKINQLLDQPISSMPGPGAEFQTSISFTQKAAWALPETALNLTVNEKASGDIAILTSGRLFEYSNGLLDQQPVTVSVPAGAAFIKVQFDISADGNLAAQGNVDGVGIMASASAGGDYTLAYYKAVSPATRIGEAVKQAILDFTLPFHQGTLRGIREGDYLYHRFAGNVALAFGANYGVSGAFFSQRSASEINKVFNSPVGSASVSLNPTFTASAGLDVGYKQADLFEMLLHRETVGSPPADEVSLHLFRSNKSDFSVNFDAAVKVDPGGGFSITPKLDTIEGQIKQHLLANVPANFQPQAKTALDGLLKTGNDKLQQFANDATSKVNSLLTTIANHPAELKVMLDREKSAISLCNYSFDLNNPAVDAAWKPAMKGDFLTAGRLPGVTLDAGSGLEQEFMRRTGVSLNLFGLLQASSAEKFFSNSAIEYAGNGVFNLKFQTGVDWDTAGKSSESEASIAFTAAATSQAMKNLQDLTVSMVVTLVDTANPKAALLSAQLVSDSGFAPLAGPGEQAGDFAKTQKQGKLTVQAEVLPSAYSKLKASAFDGKNPPALPQADDGANWSDFVASCRDLLAADAFEGFPDVCRDFQQWQEYNRFSNDISLPNRRLFNLQRIPPNWPQSVVEVARIVTCYIDAGRRFMNLCDDLSGLGIKEQQASTEEQFNAVVDTLKFMVQNDAAIWFTKPTLLALLLQLSGRGGSVRNVQVTPGSNGTQPLLNVSFTVA